ncbi:VOC family protein [Nesterenkonia halotolerans]|uniref:3-demethylubiquinone-9 3-methyltransferase (Glyoxalase superfamily) n=1 Tax=Nesterenkonia halotolerans TaxID=225325 RepID=A0ABR9J973_9MICC|nr:VOC family protein [Nesterenkonia halotolerans]MBE1515557.1 putative 3-demethylubiquinone-9 3-methyltransferase (glyoxalase superfamily) [Nesterenkonia halotolerans]
MTLCIPFLMFQGQAQEAIDHYLSVFPDAELLEIVHHPEGTEIYDPTPSSEDSTEPDDLDEAEEDELSEVEVQLDLGEESEEDFAADDLTAENVDEEADDAVVDAEEPSEVHHAVAAAPETHHTDLQLAEEDDPDEVVDVPVPLVATAQLKIGGQVLMIQDSLVKHQFSFTPSVSIAVVVDSTEEFNQIVNSLAPGGEFLMEPGDYDFATNFAWIKDRFDMSWQVNQPLAQPEPTATAEAPVWG